MTQNEIDSIEKKIYDVIDEAMTNSLVIEKDGYLICKKLVPPYETIII